MAGIPKIPTVNKILLTTVSTLNTSGGGNPLDKINNYYRPDGVSAYLQPDGTSFYVRP